MAKTILTPFQIAVLNEVANNPTLAKKIIKTLKLANTEYRVQLGLHTFLLHRGKNVLKVDFNYYPFPRVDKKLHHQKLEIDSLRDIAINKLQTISTKPRTRDFEVMFRIMT